jgi:hypothetical protein
VFRRLVTIHTEKVGSRSSYKTLDVDIDNANTQPSEEILGIQFINVSRSHEVDCEDHNCGSYGRTIKNSVETDS